MKYLKSLTIKTLLKMKRIPIGRIVIILLFCCLQLAVNAQGREVAGTVKDAEGIPMPGVSIQIKGTTQGTLTNVDGVYNLKVPDENTILVFSFVGYTASEITVGSQTAIDVNMKEDIMQLDEVVVTGYGVSKKSDLTGSLASVKEEDFNKGGMGSPEQLIQGRVTGVQITANSGAPGSGSQIRVRGAGSIRANNDPLYVVDGMPLDLTGTAPDGPTGTGVGGAPASSALNFINPNDIESIDILKDASAAAIYGSRGANGVVLITTKKGKEGKSEVNYDFKFSISQLPKKLDVLSAEEWVIWRKDSLKKPEYNMGSSTDWQNEIFRTALSHEHNLSLTGGNQKTTYRTSFNYLNQQGIIEKSDLQRFSGRLNLSQKALNDKVLFETSLIASEVIENQVPVGATGFEGDLLLNALKTNPTWPVYDSLGAPYQTGSASERNPIAMIDYTDDKTRTTRLIGGLAGTVEIIKGLNYKVNLGLDYSNANRYINQSQKLDYMKQTGGKGEVNNREIYNYLIEHTLTYSKLIGQQNITLLAGYSYQNFHNRKTKVSGGGYATDGILYTNSLGSGLQSYSSIYSTVEAYKMQSFFGRINYNLMEKYLITLTVRSDGSSKFGKNNRYGTFPSFAVGWRLSQEEFIQNLNIFSNLKLRAGWGQTGNSEIPTKNSRPVFSPKDDSRAIIGGQPVIGLVMDRTANPDLKWESTTSYNVGMDYGFFKGRLSGTVDYYIKTTKDLLLRVPTKLGAPSSEVWINIDSCKLINKGIEFSVQGAILTETDLKWDATLNFTTLKNVIKNLPATRYQTGSAQGQGLTGAYVQIITSDQPINVFYGLVVDSISPRGTIIYKKRYLDGVKTIYDSSYYIGNPQPRFTWSFNNSFAYKWFDLSIFIEGVHGNKIFNNTALLLDKTNLNTAGNSLSSFVEDDAAFNNTPKVSDRYIEDGSYVRISNLTIGYTLDLKNNAYFKRLRVYATGSNLWVFTKYTGYNPDVTNSKNMNEVNSFGIDITSYPKARTYMLGLNVTF
jgi:TonB-dependent starch-binding outer membrane protein SusC